MERHLDFTIDFETCSLSANAAVMQVAIVPWLRSNDVDPFCNDQSIQPFVGFVDLRSCVMEGFDFDQSTVEWWKRQSDAAKSAVLGGEPKPIADVFDDMFGYLRRTVKDYGLRSVCLWCQGPDVDIAIVRNLARRYGFDLEKTLPHTSFRDCRTVILEAALIEAERSLRGVSHTANGIALPEEILNHPQKAYDLYPALPDEYAAGSEAHDALYDAMRSSWLTWRALKWLRGEYERPESDNIISRFERMKHI